MFSEFWEQEAVLSADVSCEYDLGRFQLRFARIQRQCGFRFQRLRYTISVRFFYLLLCAFDIVLKIACRKYVFFNSLGAQVC